MRTPTQARATIRQDARWGPFKYFVVIHGPGLVMFPGSFTWTRRGAERKARRKIARIERKERWRAEGWEVR